MTKLNSLNGWTGAKAFNSRMSPQSFFNKGKMAMASSCSSGCGTGDDGKKLQNQVLAVQLVELETNSTLPRSLNGDNKKGRIMDKYFAFQ